VKSERIDSPGPVLYFSIDIIAPLKRFNLTGAYFSTTATIDFLNGGREEHVLWVKFTARFRTFDAESNCLISASSHTGICVFRQLEHRLAW
jgi:hypothetical protein